MNPDINNTNTNTSNTNTNTNTANISKVVIPNVATGKTDKKQKAPKSVIIYLKTRVYGAQNIVLVPQMLVPNVNSDTIFTDPELELTMRAIKDIPYNAPKETILTQFFLANEFEGLKARVLNSIFNTQKIGNDSYSFEQSKLIGSFFSKSSLNR